MRHMYTFQTTIDGHEFALRVSANAKGFTFYTVKLNGKTIGHTAGPLSAAQEVARRYMAKRRPRA
jgi:hypothetical protein